MRPNRIGGRTVDHPDFDVLWDGAQQLGVPVSFHEGWDRNTPETGHGDWSMLVSGC
jgi:hypothetical protein